MNEEEKKVIKKIEQLVEYLKKWNKNFTVIPEDVKYFEKVLEMVKTYMRMTNEGIEECLEYEEELEKKDNTIALLKVMNEELKHDFEEFKKDKDINYLDNNHHKVLVENSMGQTIDEPEECWFDAIEVKIIRNNILYGANIEKDFITLKEISDEHPEECITVIAESPLSGAIYRYNNYGNKEWQLIGSMIGYA